MFTGIISHLGKITSKKPGVLTIQAPEGLINNLSLGVSLAVNGICLTVIKIEKNRKQFEIDYTPETESKTNIKYLELDDLVNLELPVRAETLFSGHIVQGHVDVVSKILDIKKDKNSYIFTFSLSKPVAKYFVDKGSVAINGISLTVVQANDASFTVAIIPHTWKETMLKEAKSGDYVNIEVDILAKYLEKLIVNNGQYVKKK